MAWLASLFALFAVLAFLFPPSGDDWAWGSRIGLNRMHHLFADYNGRYAGDLAIIALTRLPLLAPLVVGATITAIVFLALDIVGNRTRWGYAVTTALLLAVPHAIWAEAVSWLSGFVNYALSTLAVLIFVRAVQADWRRGAQAAPRRLRAVGIVVAALVMALFMENVTVFFVVASIVLLVARRRVTGRASADAWCWATGFVAGALLMFSNGAYRRALTGHGYQRVSGPGHLASKALDTVSRLALTGNLVLCLVLVVAAGLLVVLLFRSGGWRRGIAPALLTAGFAAVAVPLAVAESVTTVEPAWRRLAGVAVALLLASLWSIGRSAVADRGRRLTLFGCVAATVVLVLPLLAVHPIGPRCFFVSYVALVMIVNLLLREAAAGYGPGPVRAAGVLGAIMTLALMSHYYVVYVPISVASHERIDTIRRQVAAGATTVTVRRLPFAEYTHTPDPTRGLWEHRYKLYYGLPPYLVIKLADHSDDNR